MIGDTSRDNALNCQGDKMKFQPGTMVKCTDRESLKGTVIPVNDPRIWTNTLAFRGTPSQTQVDQHIAWCIDNGLQFDTETPVDWGEGYLYWDSTDSLSKIGAA